MSVIATKQGGSKTADDILAKMEKLLQDIIDLHESVDDGSYYEDQEQDWNWGEDNYDEEFSGISEEQKRRFRQLIAEADKLFLAGELETAKQVYEKLTDLILYGDGLQYTVDYDELEINWRETLSRYCRCVYETAPDADRAKRMRQALAVDRQHFSDNSENLFPSLRDVFDARDGELAGWNDFLKQFRKNLSAAVSRRGILLHLEAVQWLNGLSGLAEEVRKKQAPVGYLFWLDQLRTNAAWNELAQAASEALRTMPHDALRAEAAAQLSLAGEQTGDKSLILQGRREQFFSKPNEDNLAALLREANAQQVSEMELNKALAYLEAAPKQKKPVSSLLQNPPDFSFLKIKIMLLLGRLQESYEAIDQKAAIGWSEKKRTTGAVYVSILHVLSQGHAQAKTIHSLFTRYINERYGSNAFIAEEIQQRLLQISVGSWHKEQWLKFVEQLSADRAEQIISNKYRKGYARAAEALGGYMECLILHEQRSQAAAFLDLKRNQQYKRYPAFRQELDDVVSKSPLLANLQ
ncbi:hypothetical protein [Candidatus Electronema sp. JM]|uniref:hypothetical protein n=1 Tax=Candidatus Electronema sp. JM TaxID=3401571 RepID=UPI003AA8F9E2